MMSKYSAVHDAAEKYFDRLITGRTVSDPDLLRMTTVMFDALARNPGLRKDHLPTFVQRHGTDDIKALAVPDMERFLIVLGSLYAGTETLNLELLRHDLAKKVGIVPGPVRTGCHLICTGRCVLLEGRVRSGVETSRESLEQHRRRSRTIRG